MSMSTIAPATARKLAALHETYGSQYLAAPVFGRPERASAGELWICLSGPEAARERARPLCQVLGQDVFDFGENPAAANILKLIGNFLMVAAMDAIAEALALAEKSGMDRSQVMQMLAQTLFPCPVYQGYGQTIAQKRSTSVGARLSILLKDIGLVLQEATGATVPMPLASLLYTRLLTSVARGRAEMDEVSFTLDVLEDAGLQF
jgi:3-hydroxyisobutyrate dehydrogenase-like beta-hydroxyacid dehydrogenase